jgi:hypothetical protein
MHNVFFSSECIQNSWYHATRTVIILLIDCLLLFLVLGILLLLLSAAMELGAHEPTCQATGGNLTPRHAVNEWKEESVSYNKKGY